MELTGFDKKAYRKIEGFRIATGIIAILAAASAVRRLPNLTLIGHASIFNYINGLHQIVKLTAMVIYTVFVFACYGKKQSSLLKISAAVLAGETILLTVHFVLTDMRYLILGHSIAALTGNILLCMIFTIIASKYPNFKASIKVFLLIAFAFIVFSNISSPGFLDYFSITAVISMIFGSLYIVPFLLFVLFCPPTHKRFESNASNAHLQETEPVIDYDEG